MDTLYTPQMQEHLKNIEAYLPGVLPAPDGLTDRLTEAMQYACEAGGKRLRPVLTLEFCQICGGRKEEALPFAAAVEMIHSYSLIHDDLPCMDNSPLRRGKPSVHAAFGEDIALLAGDALLTRAFEVALRSGSEPSRVLHAIRILADGAGADGMVGGQMLDLESEGKSISLEVLERLQEGKTAALIMAACQMGAVIAGGTDSQITAAGKYGRQIGLSFQIVDDILDATRTAQELGKPAGSDAAHEKSTYVSLLGLEKARSLAEERTRRALDALSLFGSEADGLRGLSKALLTRTR